MLKAITANDLADGTVVFLTRDGSWSSRAQGAALAHDDAELGALTAAAREAEAARVVVGAYEIDMAETETGPWPTRNREQIRALGPTVRTDLGLQAQAQQWDMTDVSI